jgi:hypothetical protein
MVIMELIKSMFIEKIIIIISIFINVSRPLDEYKIKCFKNNSELNHDVFKYEI